MKKLFELHKECKNAQIKVLEPLQHLSDKFDEMERGNNKKDEQISQLEERTWILEYSEYKNKCVLESLNESEQYFCRNCLLLYWIKEESKEDINNVNMNSLSEDLNIELD